MMQIFRKAAASWAAKLLIGCLALSFGIWGINDIFRGYRTSALASVGRYEISAEVFRRSLQQRLRVISRQSGQPITAERAREIGLDRQFLAEMLRDGTLEEQARYLRLAIPDTVVAQDIAKEQVFQNSHGQFDPEKFRNILQQNGLTEQMFLNDEKAGRMREAIAGAVIGDLPVPKTLVQAVVQQSTEQRDAKYFVVTANEADIPPASDADLKKFYTANPKAFTAPAYRSLEIMKVEPQDLTAGMTVTEEDIAKAYEIRKEEYGSPEHRTIEQITFPNLAEAQAAKTRISQGTDFSTIAKERGLQDKDVILGDVKKTDILDKAIADAAFSLSEGAVSDPVQGKLSIALVRATKVVPASVKPLSDVRDDLVQKVKLDRARDQILTIHDKVEDARGSGSSFEDIAKSLNLALISVPAIDAQGLGKDGKPVPGIPAENDVLKLGFESDVGVENDSIQTPDDGSVWVEVRDVIPAALKPFDEVKADVEAQLKAQKLRESVLAKAKDLVKRAESGTSLETLAQESGAEIKTELGLKRSETSEKFDVEAISALFTTPDNGYAFSPEPDGKGAIVMQAMPVMNVPFDAKSKEASAAQDALKRGLTNDMLALYVADLQKRLGVSINDGLWQQVTGSGQ